MRLVRKVHRYFGLATALAVIVVAVTGVLLVHRKALGLSKVFLALPGYAARTPPDAWDVAAVVQDGPTLVATRQGLYRDGGSGWEQVLPCPTRQVLQVGDFLYAGTREGAFASNDAGKTWRLALQKGEVKALLPTREGLVAATTEGIFRQNGGGQGQWDTLLSFGRKPLDVRKLLPVSGGLVLATKEGIFRLTSGTLSPVPLPTAEAGAQGVDLQKLLTDLHTGDFFGRWFFLAVNATGAALVLLAVTGIFLWYRPWNKKREALRESGRGSCRAPTLFHRTQPCPLTGDRP